MNGSKNLQMYIFPYHYFPNCVLQPISRLLNLLRYDQHFLMDLNTRENIAKNLVLILVLQLYTILCLSVSWDIM
jgi:hypothetical protein